MDCLFFLFLSFSRDLGYRRQRDEVDVDERDVDEDIAEVSVWIV